MWVDKYVDIDQSLTEKPRRCYTGFSHVCFTFYRWLYLVNPVIPLARDRCSPIGTKSLRNLARVTMAWHGYALIWYPKALSKSELLLENIYVYVAYIGYLIFYYLYSC